MPAVAQDPTPEPMPCVGLSIKDPAGDAAGLGLTGAENTDITGVFFRYSEDKKLTVNLRVANLDKAITDGTLGTRWTVDYSVGEDSFYALADLAPGGGVTFRHGKVGRLSSGDVQLTTATEGRFVEGKDGIIEIVLPADGLEGKKLTDVAAESRGIWARAEGSSLGPRLDAAPDDGAGKSFTVAACPTEPTPAADAAPVAPPEAPAPPPAPAPQQPAAGTQPQTRDGATRRTTRSKKKACQKKAKKIKNKKKRKAARKRCAKIKK